MNSSKEKDSIRFSVTKDEEGWHAQAEGMSIFTEGDTLEELKANIKEAVQVHLRDGEYKKYGLSSENPEIFLAFHYEESLA
ncbi:MAG: type II toxin-antitoxin system HicB family antitoxin [Planctomycetota bacterium]|jgi:predicted RNase H-like HicB family nuclease